jgi:uncharacterized protein YbcV (DUF1398 family)
MFTLDQIKEAHSKTKTGVDFPQYIQDLIKIGVTSYNTYVNDGHTEYFGKNSYKIQSESRYPSIEVAAKGDIKNFADRLKMHQQGQTNYPTFCKDAAKTGVERWTVDMTAMTCTYYDKLKIKMLVEKISMS